MPQLKRRQFLQFAGSALGTLGLCQMDLMRQGDRYTSVLAQSTSRKLALLLGINTYPSPLPSLQGCLTDVELQRELLTYRFGFNPKDILTITNETSLKPTRQSILEAFENHLIKQAKPGDVVVLDCCHSGGGTRGNLVFRAVPSRWGGAAAQASPEEFEYQQQWLSRLKLSRDEFFNLRKKGIAKGVAFGSAQHSQLAADVPFGDFHAGAFTYLLTRYLWQQPVSQPVSSVFINLARSTKDVAESSGVIQEPIFEVKPESNNDKKPVYFLDPPTPAAEAVVQSVKGNQIEFWLGGVSSVSLDSFKEGVIFTLTDAQGRVQGEVEQTSRVGLIGYGNLRQVRSGATLQAGTLLREKIRGISEDVKLRLGLDQSLGKQLEPARVALQTLRRIEVVTVDQKVVVDYLFGQMTEDYLKQTRQQGEATLPPVGSVGLFTAGLTLVSDSFGQVGESMEAAVNRLGSRLKLLLAGRILQLVFNGNASNLKVATTIKPKSGKGVSSNFSSRGAQESAKISPAISTTAQALAPGTEIQVEVRNDESHDLYIGVLVIGSNGDIVVLYPADWDAPEAAALVAPGQLLIVPPPNDDFHFVVQGPSGFIELLILASTEPLREALRGLQQIARGRGTRSGTPLPLEEDEPVEVMETLLADLDRNARTGTALPRGIRGVDTTKLAAISAIIQVVE